MTLSVVNVGYPLAVVGPDAVGGAEQIVHALARAVTEAGQRSTVIAPEGSIVAGELSALAAASAPFDDEQKRNARRACRNALAALEHSADVVHFHGVDFAEYLPGSGRRFVATLHLPVTFYAAESLAACEARAEFVAVSYAQAATARGFGLTRVIPNGVDVERLVPGGERKSYVLALGRICPEKGFHLAVGAAKRARLPLLIGGQVYPYREHRAYFEAELEPSLDDERRFVGAVGGEAKRRLLAEARCLIVPSLVEETSSLVAMEALACGTPVVGLRRGALAEVVKHGETGLLVERPEELADAILDVGAIDPERCRRAAVERFALERMTRDYLAVYARLAADRARAGAPRPAPSAEAPLRFRSIHSHDALGELVPAWRELWARCPRPSVFSRPEWLLPWLRAFTPERLLVVVAERDDRLEGLLPLCIPEGSRGPWQLVGVGVSDYGEVLAATPALLGPLLERARDETRTAGLVFDDAPCDGALTDEVRRRGGGVVTQTACPVLELAAGDPFASVPDELRRRLPRDRRRAEREGLRLELVDQRSLAETLRALFAFGSSRFGRESAFFSEQRARTFQLEAAAGLHAAGVLRLHALRRGNECLGALYGFRCGERLLSYQHAYAASVAHLGAGILLTAQAIEAAGTEGCTSFDFLRGREPYKYRWGRPRPRARPAVVAGRALDRSGTCVLSLGHRADAGTTRALGAGILLWCVVALTPRATDLARAALDM